MDDRKEKSAPWLSVPQFGDWDQKGVMPDYSMDFSKIRENRKQNKSRASLGNEEELISSTNSKSNTVHSAHTDDLHYHQNHPSTTRVLQIQSLYLCEIVVRSAYISPSPDPTGQGEASSATSTAV